MVRTAHRLPNDRDIIEIHKDIEGELHADHGPALVYRAAYQADTLITEFFKHGVYHNEWGPAELMEQNGSQISAYWYIDGIEVARTHDGWEEFLKLRGLPKEDAVTLKMMS